MKHRGWLHGLKKWSAVLCAVFLLLAIVPVSLTFATDVASESALKTAISKGEAIKLTKDITVTGSSWTSYSYNSTFNGNGHVIKGLTKPLFQSLGANASVTNLGVMAAPTLTSGSGQNVLALLAVTSQGAIQSCFAYGTIHYTGTGVVGGLVSEMNGGSITDSFSCIDITAPSATHVGGFVGKINSGTITACYSSGAIDASGMTCHTAGFANRVSGTVSHTYTTCQLRASTPLAKASGVDGLYDNQMSLVRDDVSHRGVPTMQLMGNAPLSNPYTALSTSYFATTSTSYPMLKSFANAIWSPQARDVVNVSTAAVALSDVEGESNRYEPTALSDEYVARTDYLTGTTYADKTNMKSLTWSMNSTSCKMYDTVPVTSMPNTSGDTFTAGTHASLLRAKLEFSADVDDAELRAQTGEVYRTWYLTARTATNPYYGASYGDTDNTTGGAFPIASVDDLHYVRYYSLIGPACYYLKENLTLSNWLPISGFSGTLNGNDKSIYNLSIDPTYTGTDYGMFASTQLNAYIRNMNMMNAKIDTSTQSEPTNVGALVGSTGENTKVTDIVLYGDGNVIKGNGNTGGLVGSSNLTSFYRCLVSVELQGLASCGGIVGTMTKGSLNQCGSTGYVAYGSRVGGLAGKIENTSVKIQDSYSTALVISEMSGAVVGGLVGEAGSATFTRCYAANLAEAVNGTAHPLRGSGSGTLSSTYFDVAYAQNADESASQKRTTAELMALTLSASYWVTSTTNYPQIKYFDGKSDTSYQGRLTKVSTTPVYIQNQWPDTTDDLTTGWIGPVSTFVTPTKLTAFDNGTKVIAPLDSQTGYMFEAAQDQRRVALMTKEKSSPSGIRVIAFVQEDLIPIRYTVSGTSGAKAYVQLYYGSDEAGWTKYSVMTATGGVSEVLYNIPKGQRIKVVVECDDKYKVSSVKATSSGTTSTMTLSGGAYTVSKTYNSAVTIAINMTTNSAPWGLRRQAY